jgi:gliding motility-associated-like protein
MFIFKSKNKCVLLLVYKVIHLLTFLRLKKTPVFIIAAIVYAANAYTQNSNFNWVQQLDRKTGLPFDESYFIGTDAAKNVYVAGNFHFTVDLDPGPGATNVSSNFDNIFVCKFNSSGSFIWGRHLGKNDRYTVCKSLSVDSKGNVFTTGYFTGTADFDPGAGVYNLSANASVNSESPDIFISCLDTDGNLRWAKQIGDNNIDIANSITADIFGNVYITGYFSGVVDLDPGFGRSDKGKQNVANTFIIKLDIGGNFKFAQVFEGTHTATGKFIRTDNKGNLFISGYFYGDVDFDPGTGIRLLSTGITAESNFLSKLDSSGNFAWAIKDITGLDIATDGLGNVYTYFDLLTKYDANGNEVWMRPTGGTPNTTFAYADITTDANGNIYFTGLFHYTRDFDPGPAEYNLTTNGGGYASDVFVCKLDNNGMFVWAKSFGGRAEDYATSITVDNDENVYTTGVFLGTADFDGGPGTYPLTSPAGGGIFIHKMSRCNNIPPVTLTIEECKSYTLNNTTYKNSGTYTQVITTNTGCDSIIHLNLIINSINTNVQATTCNRYSFGRKSLSTSGQYTDTLQAINGCDSIVHLDLTVTKSTTSTNVAICSGETYAGHTTEGTYTDTFRTANGCDSVVTVHLAVLQKPAPDLGADKELCPGDSITLIAGNFQTYQWNDGSTSATQLVKNAGSYTVNVVNACGVGRDEIRVTEATCGMYFPTAFTPNNDGKNERFALLHPQQLSDFKLLVYNRFGELVFQTKDYSKGWTGMHKNVAAPGGTYVWYSQFKRSGVVSNLKGTVLLIR